ncbi:uncharacterized protein LOC135080810 [Ostrinia nubilalis]|uniref:uncharacterized protein LOC135080810 n=1 Tax=Ostrinia nubilalis TaxID=29057 RepID=UPI0030825C9F
MLLVMVSGTSYLWRSYSPTEGALYAAANRPVWAIGVVLLILCCSFGDVPLLKSFLCWYPWVPLSRLAYGLYLTHTVLIIRNVGIARNPVYYDNLSVFMSSLSVICLGTFCAFIIWLLAEAPVNNLFMLCLKPSSSGARLFGNITAANAAAHNDIIGGERARGEGRMRAFDGQGRGRAILPRAAASAGPSPSRWLSQNNLWAPNAQ